MSIIICIEKNLERGRKMNFEDMSLEDLIKLKEKIETLISQKQEKKVVITLSYNHYKGSGKCWVAKIEPNTKKILNFVNAVGVDKRDNYRGTKNFELSDGYYLRCQEGSKKNDDRKYFQILSGNIIEL